MADKPTSRHRQTAVTRRPRRAGSPTLEPLIVTGTLRQAPDVRPCEWCRRPTAWEFTMLGAARPVRACNDLCAKKALRLAERPEVAACRPDHAEKALRRSGGEGQKDLEGGSEAVAGSRLNPWGHFEASPVRESCHANSEKPVACPGHGYKQGSGRERSRRRRK